MTDPQQDPAVLTPPADLPAGLRPAQAVEPTWTSPRPLGTGRVLLSRDDILKVADVQSEEVDVPQWGGTVLVRGLTGRERDQFEASTAVMRGKELVPNLENIRAKLVAWCVCDAGGNSLFTQQDVRALGEKSGAALDLVFAVAQRLSGMSDQDVADLEKVSGTAAGGGSTSS